MKKLTLITMGAGNVKVLLETFLSLSNVCDEIIYGDMLLFEEDRKILESYKSEFNLKVVVLPFNYIFKNGFASVLNLLSEYATNDWCIYMNTSEVISIDKGILEALNTKENYNSFCFDHPQETHRWYRMYDRKQLHWEGNIHEELRGKRMNFYIVPIFTMIDLPKDNDNLFKAKVLDDLKELVYFNQYIKLVEQPESIGATNFGWVKYAQENYDSLIERLNKKGARYEALKEGDFAKYINDVYTNPEFEKERFESSNLIDFQLDKKTLL